MTLAFDLPPVAAPSADRAIPAEVALAFDLPPALPQEAPEAAPELFPETLPAPSEAVGLEARLPVPPVPPPLGDGPTELPPPPALAAANAAFGQGPPDLFTGGADSLVARAVGSAEGTRTPQGDRTVAYYGHRDPGNGVWNLGSFSYQHGATSPEEADDRQLQRLQRQAAELALQAQAQGLDLTPTETLNGIDLANQAPLAALERGYVDWLRQAHDLGMTGDEAILYARTRSFLDPDTGRWNAPGLGNAVATISQDQARRMDAIAQTIALEPQAYLPSTAPVHPLTAASPEAAPKASNSAPAEPTPAQIVDGILSLDLP